MEEEERKEEREGDWHRATYYSDIVDSPISSALRGASETDTG